jgi:hypothetical protein
MNFHLTHTASITLQARKEKDVLDQEIKAEEEQIDKILGPQVNAETLPSSADEIGKASDEWSKGKQSEYDVLKSLTSVQSRVESLQSKGVGVDMVTVEQLVSIVSKGKEHSAAVRASEEKKAKAEAEKRAAEEVRKAEAVAEAKKTAERKDKELKAANFMRRLSGST